MHAKLHPEWSARDNYAIHSKRKRKRDPFSSSFLGKYSLHCSMSLNCVKCLYLYMYVGVRVSEH